MDILTLTYLVGSIVGLLLYTQEYCVIEVQANTEIPIRGPTTNTNETLQNITRTMKPRSIKLNKTRENEMIWDMAKGYIVNHTFSTSSHKNDLDRNFTYPTGLPMVTQHTTSRPRNHGINWTDYMTAPYMQTSSIPRIYHRGHLVNKHAHNKQADTLLSARKSHVLDFREPKTNTSRRHKRKHKEPSSFLFHNYKLIHKTVHQSAIGHPIGLHPWVFGAGMVALGCLVTLSSIVTFYYCTERVKKKQEINRRHHRLDEAGDYQRVESVSSIVDHVTQPGLYDDEEEDVDLIDDITVI